jgi:hypothetical protein
MNVRLVHQVANMIATAGAFLAVAEPFKDIEDARALAQAIVDTVREPLLVLDGDLRVPKIGPFGENIPDRTAAKSVCCRIIP